MSKVWGVQGPRHAALYVVAIFGVMCAVAGVQTACAQTPGQPASPSPTTTTPNPLQKPTLPGATKNGNAGGSNPGKPPDSKPASAGSDGKTGGGSQPNEAATGADMKLGPTSPAATPPGPKGRKRIGLALGGGGALAMSEIGVLQWFEEHHIPVDELAGTSMGALVGSLYATGHSIEQMKNVMNDDVFSSVFRVNTAYKARSFRRREDERELPNAIGIGLKHGVSFRNSILNDTGLNAFLDREFLRYDDRTDFNTLPIPFRCLSTDLNEGQTVTFARGSIPDAVRASVSIPGLYRPFTMNGHQFVDGAVLQNLPTRTVHDGMKADVVLAVSLPLSPVNQTDMSSIFGVLQRAFSVAIEGNEREGRKLADVVIEPNVSGYSASDYLKIRDLADRGYQAAEAMKAQLLPYAVSDADWNAYIAARNAKSRGPAGNVLEVRVKAQSVAAQRAVQRMFEPIVGKPIDTAMIEKLLAEVRSDGRYDADYTVGYSENEQSKPVVLVNVQDNASGPPFVLLGANVAAQTGGVTRATIEASFLDQDLGGYGSEFRANVKLGFLTDLNAEYYRKIGTRGFFVAPQGGLLREPYYIYVNQQRIAERQLQKAGGGGDLGWSNGRTWELRAGWTANDIRWTKTTGTDGQPDYLQHSQKGRVQFIYDTQDRAYVPQYGFRSQTDLGYLYDTPGSPSAPQLYQRFTYATTFAKKNVFITSAEGATMFDRNVAQPFRYTLGGPFRLGAAAIDEFRGTDYFLIQPAYLRRIAKLPAVLGQSIYAGAMYEAGQMRGPDQRTITRQDVSFGLVGETPLGVITFAPTIGDGGYRKFVFTLGKLF